MNPLGDMAKRGRGAPRGGLNYARMAVLKSYFKEYNYLMPKVVVSVFSNLFKSFIYKVPEI